MDLPHPRDGISQVEQAIDLHLEAQVALDLVESALGTRASTILQRRYGIGGGPEETLDAIGQSLGLTRERIRQIEKKALDLLRDSGQLAGVETWAPS